MSSQRIIANIAIMIGLTTGLLSYADTKSQNSPSLSSMVSNVQKECKSDLNKYCKSVTPGDGRIAACLDSKEDKLSSECRSAWMNTKAQVSNRMDKAEVSFRKSCGKDVQKHCADVPSGQGRLLDCLDDHKGSLSSSCDKFFSTLDQKLSELVG